MVGWQFFRMIQRVCEMIQPGGLGRPWPRSIWAEGFLCEAFGPLALR